MHGYDDFMQGPPPDFYRNDGPGRHLGHEIADGNRRGRGDDPDVPQVTFAPLTAPISQPVVAPPLGRDLLSAPPDPVLQPASGPLLSRDLLIAPSANDTAAIRQTIVTPLQPLITPTLRPAASETVGTTTATIIVVTTYVPVSVRFTPELVLYRDTVASRQITDVVGGYFAADSRSASSVSMSSVSMPSMSMSSAAERRLESQPSFAIARLSSELTAGLEQGQVKVYEPGISQHFFSSLLIGPSSALQTDSARSGNLSIVDRNGQLVNPADEGGAVVATSDDSAELIELPAGDTLRQKRKSALDDANDSARTSPRLAPLAELPISRDPQSFLSELARLVDDRIWGGQPVEQQSSEQTPDDGLIELLAADVGSLRSRGSLPVAVAPVAAVRAMTLDAGVALYQPLDVAQLDGASADVPDATPLAEAPPPADRPTGAE
jgi:hypothetical protein